MSRFRGFTKKNRTGLLLALFLTVSVVLLSFTGKKIHFRPQEVGMSVMSVFQIGFSEVGDFFARTVRSVHELQVLQKEYEELQNRLENYRTLERDLVELKDENRRLTEQLEFSKRISMSHVAAEIIAKDPGNLFNTIVINKGFRHGVTSDMPVMAFQDGFYGIVGKTVNVGLLSSEVLPLFDRRSNVAARLQNARYEGLVMGLGRNEQLLVMKYVKKRARSEISYGDLVITSGMSSVYPRGIYIGRVRSIEAKDYELSLTISLEPVIDFSKLEYVFVLKQVPE